VAAEARRFLINEHLLRGAEFDLVIVADPASIPEAVRLTGPGRVRYSIDDLPAAGG
jgi:hypothetical protein